MARTLQRTTKTYVILPVASPRVGPGLRQVVFAPEVMEGSLISPPYLPTRQLDSVPDTDRFLQECAAKEVTFAEGDPGGSPNRSWAEPFVAEEIYQVRQRTSLSMLRV